MITIREIEKKIAANFDDIGRLEYEMRQICEQNAKDFVRGIFSGFATANRRNNPSREGNKKDAIDKLRRKNE